MTALQILFLFFSVMYEHILNIEVQIQFNEKHVENTWPSFAGDIQGSLASEVD